MPIVLYPLMGMALLQTAQLMHQSPPRILLVGGDTLSVNPGLVTRDGFNPDLSSSESTGGCSVVFDDMLPPDQRQQLLAILSDDDPESMHLRMNQLLKRTGFDLVMVANGSMIDGVPAANIKMIANSTSDQSALAAAYVNKMIDSWKAITLQKTIGRARHFH